MSTSNRRMQALGRLKTGEMNQTERRYADRLETLYKAGEIAWYAFEPMNLRLGDKCFYRVDFMIMLNDGRLEAHEVKGFWTDDARVKIKVAAEKFPFPFVAVKWVKKQWEFETF